MPSTLYTSLPVAPTLPNNCYGIWKGAKGRNQISFVRLFTQSVTTPHKWLEYLEGFEMSVPGIWAVEPFRHLSLKRAGVYLGFTLTQGYFVLEDLKAERDACGLAGWWWVRVVRVTGRGEGRQPQGLCARGCSSSGGTVTGPSPIVFTVPLRNRRFQA